MTQWIATAATLAFVLAAPLTSRAQVQLRFKLADGQKSTTITSTKTRSVLSVLGRELKSGSEQTMTIISRVGQRDTTGIVKVSHAIGALSAERALPGGDKLVFDSAKVVRPVGAKFAVALDTLKATSRAKWVTIHDKDNQVVSVLGSESFLAELDESTKKTVQKQFDPEYLKQQANSSMNRIPANPISPGATWERTDTMRLEGGQNITLRTRYAYQGLVNQDGKDLDKIASQCMSVEYSIDPDAATLMRVVKSDLKVARSSGMLLFDREQGQVVTSRDALRIQGKVTVSVSGIRFTGGLDLAMGMTSVTRNESGLGR